MSGALYLDEYVDSKCKNRIDSYGMFCVRCNCCGRLNPKTMYACRLRLAKRLLKEDVAKLTHPDFQTAGHQKNIHIDIAYFRGQVAYNRRKMKAMGVSK